jgi:small conductance mechanosensitive channel
LDNILLALLAEIVIFMATTAIIGFLVIRIINRIAKRAGASPAVLHDIRDVVVVIVIGVIIAGVARATGATSEFTTLTVSGVAGLAVSLALQSTLSNIISGILLFHDGVLKLGDEIEYSGIRGTVERIALRNSWVKTKEGEIVVISNTSLASGPLTNYTAKDRLLKLGRKDRKS